MTIMDYGALQLICNLAENFKKQSLFASGSIDVCPQIIEKFSELFSNLNRYFPQFFFVMQGGELHKSFKLSRRKNL